MKTKVSHFVVLICLRNSDGGTPAKMKGTTHPSTLPDLDAPPHASRGRALPLERRQCCGPSAAMGVKLSASEASQPMWAKTPRGAVLRVPCSHFRYTWRLKKKSNVSAIFSNDQSHLPGNACEVVFLPPLPLFTAPLQVVINEISLSNSCRRSTA